MAGKGKGGSGSGIRPSRAKTPPAGSSGKATAAERGGARSPGRSAAQGIPPAVANRMARRIAIATGLPSLLGMGVFIASYVLVSRSILEIPPGVTLVASGACFLLGLLGLSYGVLSASWEDAPGSLLGLEQIGVNVGRLRSSLRRPPAGS